MTYNHGGDLRNYRRPGQEFVQLIEETRDTFEELEDHRLHAAERTDRVASLG